MSRSRRLQTRVAFTLLVVVVVLAAGPTAVAAQSQTGISGTVVVGEGETVSDVSAVAGTVVVEEGGTVTGDVSAFAGNVYVHGTVEGDLSAAAGNVEITGTVAGEVSVGAGNLLLADGATVGSLQAGVGNAELYGTIEGDASVGADSITLAESTAIAGDLRYDGDLEGPTDGVAGDVTRDSTLGFDVAPTLQPISEALFAVYALVLNLLLGAALLALFPRFSADVAARVAGNPVRTGLVGLLVLVAVPILLVAIAITVIGIPITLVGALLFVLVVWIAVVYGRFAVAAWLLSSLGVESRWLALVVGLVGGALLVRVPFVGGLLNLVLFLLGLGALSGALYGHYRRGRARPAGDTQPGPEYGPERSPGE
ncbi:bactofilin family protein [Natronobiforma cellulositropha]|uniref:bactofilin family protein n=1 Tax=Natronobiforma cellulositropha TaxID=1679076 RepID=UPI0021D5FB53|nr:polymer-forming cytoskeletal protein [Natronobiforma cellulositropha]